MQEKCDLEKQNIKLLVSLDAVSAKREVYEGRWHEAMDELEEMHKELNISKHRIISSSRKEIVMVQKGNTVRFCISNTIPSD